MREIRARRAILAGVLEVSVKCGRLPPDAGDLTGLNYNGPETSPRCGFIILITLFTVLTRGGNAVASASGTGSAISTHRFSKVVNRYTPFRRWTVTTVVKSVNHLKRPKFPRIHAAFTNDLPGIWALTF